MSAYTIERYETVAEPGLTDHEIVSLLDDRVRMRGKRHQSLIDVRDTYNGDLVVPLPEIDEAEAASVPNLLAVGVDGTAQRIASTIPNIYFPEDADGDTGAARKRARSRGDVVRAWWDANNLDLKLYRRARHYAAYGRYVSFIRPSARLGAPCYETRDPLTCVDTETEILTRRGWLRHDELVVGDEVAGYDMDLGLARWTTCQHVNRFDYDGDLVSVERRGLSMRLTPDHRCVVQKRLSRTENRPGSVHVTLAEHLNSTHYIPQAAEWEAFGEKSIGVDLAALCGWVAAEGHYPGGDLVCLTQSESANPVHVAEIDAILDRLGSFWPVDASSRSSLKRKVLTVRRSERARLRSGDRPAVDVEWRLPLGLGQEIRRLMPEKMLGTWCLDLPEDERRALLDAFTKGDGSIGAQTSICQKLRPNLDILQMVAVTLGYRATLRPDAKNNKWVLYLGKNRKPSSLRARGEGASPGLMPRARYAGEVWCPTTGTGTWFARRGGQVFITGNCYPSDDVNEDFQASDCIFTFTRNGSWITDMYPDVEAQFRGMDRGYEQRLYQIVEYVDDDEWVVLARCKPGFDYGTQSARDALIRLDRIENRIGKCPIILGGRYGLDRDIGQFTQLVGMFWTASKLQALETIAVTRDVFPNVWVQGDNGQNPSVIVEADGLRNIRGEIRNGSIHVEQSNPGYMTSGTLDRLERAQRVAGRIPAEFGGEGATNVRTGKRGDSIMSATIDFVVQEAQRTIARGLQYENQLAIAIDKAYYGATRKSIYLGFTGTKKSDMYVPKDLWTTDRHEVAYTHAGADANTLTIGLLQLAGAGMMSKRSVMMKHPLIDNAELEHDFVQAESLEAALLGSVTTMAAQGQLPPTDLARLMQLIKNDKLELPEAMMKVQEEAQARQAKQVEPTAPEAQPGIANPGTGAESATIPPVAPGMRNLQSLLGNTRLINSPMGAEQTPVGNVSAGST